MKKNLPENKDKKMPDYIVAWGMSAKKLGDPWVKDIPQEKFRAEYIKNLKKLKGENND